MNKKILIGIIAFLVIVIFIVCAIFIINKNSTHEANNYESVENKLTGDSKILVVYYSAQNHTKNVANKIAENLGADIYELVPVDVYTEDDLDWTNSNSRVSLEHNDTSLRDIELVSTKIDGFENYDTILIGYPIWWGIAAWPVNSFVKSNDFTGKTVIPFCTAYSSGIGQSGKLLEDLAGTGNWLDGIRFSENPSDSDIKSWTDSLK
jgi:flavodoxin